MDVETQAAMLETLVESVDAAVWIVDAGTEETLFVNRAWSQIHGRPREDAYEDPMCWLEQVHEDDLDEVTTWIGSEGPSGSDQEFRLRHPDDGIRHLVAEAHAAEAPGGEGTWYVGTIRDITELREERRRRRGAERLYARLLDAAGAVVFRVHGDPSEANVEFGGPNVPLLTGYPASAFEEDDTLWFERIHPEDRGALADATIESYERQVRRQEVYRFDRRGSDGWVWHETHLFPDRGDDGELVGVTGFTVDITERMRTRQQLERTLRETSGALDRFADVAAHDLKEPLREIVTNIQRAEREMGDGASPEIRSHLQAAVDGAKGIRRLINEIREFTQAGRETDDRRTVDLDACLDDALGKLADQIADADASVTREPLPSAVCNRDQIARVLVDLVENAVTFQDERPIRVHVDGYRFEGQATVVVEDNGIGIDPAYHRKIFELFERLHGPGAYPGTGLGLGLVQRIVQRHGGEVWLDSEPGLGSRFFVSLPVVHARENEPAATEAG